MERHSGAENARLLTAELQRLCRHRGLRASRIAVRCGPLLAELTGISVDTSDYEARRRIQALVERIAVVLSADEARLVRCALAAGSDRMAVKLGDRLAAAAVEFGYAERTLRRRLADALGELGRAASAQLEHEDAEHRCWYLRRFDAALRLDGEYPEVTERRTIVARRDGVRRIVTRFSVPGSGATVLGPDEFTVRATRGAVIGKIRRLSDAMFECELELPGPLGYGREHEYELIFRLPPGWPVQPHYALVPTVDCELFRLQVRFDPGRPPRSVVRLDGLEYRELEGRRAPGGTVCLDSLGSVVLTFENLVKRRVYGIEWAHADQ